MGHRAMGAAAAGMTDLRDTAELAEALIACPSVTPAAGLVFDCLERMLAPLGFAIHRFEAGEPPDGPVENLFATDLAFLQQLYNRINDLEHASGTCPQCGRPFDDHEAMPAEGERLGKWPATPSIN